MADLQLTLKLIAEAQSAVAGLQAVAKEIRSVGVASAETSTGAKGMSAAITAAGDAPATAIGQVTGALATAQVAAKELEGEIATMRGISPEVAAEIARLTSGLAAAEAQAAGFATELATVKRLPPGLDTDVQALTASLSQAEARIVELGRESAALKALPPRIAPDIVNVGRSAEVSSQQVGMMAAQLNDVVMMTMAGQSPMQMAIQQGTQITQAFGQAGAAGALRMMGAGLLSMLSPLNLAVYAALAFGSALVQALLNSGEQVETLDDAIKRLQGSVKDLQSASSASLEELKKKYGEVTPEVRKLNDEMARLAGVEAIQAAVAAMKSLKAETEGSWWSDINGKAFLNSEQAADTLDVPYGTPDQLGILQANPVIPKFQAAVDQAASAKGWDAQIASVRQLEDVIIEAAGGIDNMSLKQAQLLAQYQSIEAALRQMKAAQDGVGSAQEKSNQTLSAQIAQLRSQAAIVAAIKAYGEDSVVVANMKLAAEREVARAQIMGSEAAADLKEQAMAAWDAARGIASEDIFKGIQAGTLAATDLEKWLKQSWNSADGIGGADIARSIRAALSPAQQLAAALWDGFNAANARANVVETGSGQLIRKDALYGNMGGRGLPSVGGVAPVVNETVTKPKGGGGGGGTSGDDLASVSKRAADAMQQLDDALAAIQLKSKAGILSAADAADAVTSAQGQAADALAGLIPDLERLGPAGKAAAEKWKGAFGDLAEQLQGVKGTVQDLSKDMSEGFKAPFADFIAGTKSGADAWDDFLGQINQSIAQKLSSKVTDGLLSPVLDGLFAGLGSMFKFADGGVPGLGQFSGQVLSSPTLFAMPGGGLGQMAEAGTEAIMPVTQGPGGLSVRALAQGRETLLALTRGADGKLGVQLPDWAPPAVPALARFATGGVPGAGAIGLASGGAGTSGGTAGASTIIINNNAPAQVAASERMEGNSRIVTVMIEAVRDQVADDINSGRGAVPSALQSAYGLNRVGR